MDFLRSLIHLSSFSEKKTKKGLKQHNENEAYNTKAQENNVVAFSHNNNDNVGRESRSTVCGIIICGGVGNIVMQI